MILLTRNFWQINFWQKIFDKLGFDKKFLINLILQIIFLTKTILKNLILERKIGTRQICDLKKNIWKKDVFIWQSKFLAFYDLKDFFGQIGVLTNNFSMKRFLCLTKNCRTKMVLTFFFRQFFFENLAFDAFHFWQRARRQLPHIPLGCVPFLL